MLALPGSNPGSDPNALSFWKGLAMSNKRLLNGYVTVYCPSHPRAMCGTGYEGYVYEHILVAESMLGRPLLSDEVVHHLDFDKSNNTHTNLLVLQLPAF